MALGIKLIKKETKFTNLCVYKKYFDGKYQLETNLNFDYDDACMIFNFDKKNNKELLFFTPKELFSLHYNDPNAKRKTKFRYQFELKDKPHFGIFDLEQRKFIITSDEDALYVDMDKKEEINLDDQEGISSIQNIVADKSTFYILANKRDNRLGIYIFSMDMNNPTKPANYLINWSNKLDIADCDLHLMQITKGRFIKKSLVVSYKSIGINTFNVSVIDLKTKLVKYWHESY